jgi:hypothetical protein
MIYIRKWLKKVPLINTIILSIFLFLSTSTSASDVPRFDFSKSLQKYESHKNQYFERIIFESSDADFKKFRIEQIKGISKAYSGFGGGGVHVTVLFNITDLVPSEFNLYEHDKSIVAPHLGVLKESLSDNDKAYARIKIIGEPYFHSNHNDTQHYEKVDMFIDKVFVEPIVEHPMFIDIAHTGTTHGIVSHGPPGEVTVRLSDSEPRGSYSNAVLRKGYYKEIAEALQLKPWVNIHVELNEPSELDRVIKNLNKDDHKVIRKADSELLIAVNDASANKLLRDRNVKLMKDYEYHHGLNLKRGMWKPYPLSKIRAASKEEISRIVFKSRANFYREETQVIESEDQLNSFFKSIDVNVMEDAYKAENKRQKIDFSKSNLLIYSQIEPSGSIGLKTRDPIWVDGKLVVPIDSSSGQIHTQDMAQHFFVYIVDKDIPSVDFYSGRKKASIINSAKDKSKSTTSK